MAKEATVPVKYLDSGAEGVDTSGGIVIEMCTQCFALAPTDKIQQHIDSHVQLTGERVPEQGEPGQQPEQPPAEPGQLPDEAPPETGTPEQGVPGTPGQQPTTGST